MFSPDERARIEATAFEQALKQPTNALVYEALRKLGYTVQDSTAPFPFLLTRDDRLFLKRLFISAD